MQQDDRMQEIVLGRLNPKPWGHDKRQFCQHHTLYAKIWNIFWPGSAYLYKGVTDKVYCGI